MKTRHVAWLMLTVCGCNAQTSQTTEGPGALWNHTTQLSPQTQAYAAELKQTLDRAREASPDALASQLAPILTSQLPYDPMAAQHLGLIQQSKLQLNPSELSSFAKNGFALSQRQQFPSFAYGYATIYAEDLPVFISADSILDALHRSYDKLLASCEKALLIGDLAALLTDLLGAVRASSPSPTQQDLTLYLSVADALLRGTNPNNLETQVKHIVELATAAEGTAEFTLFGAPRMEDMSQFMPRGHYLESPELQRYFRAMMWLGRVDFRMVETVDSKQVVRRDQLEAALVLDELLSEQSRTRFAHIDQILQAFVGGSDNLTPSHMPELRKALGIARSSEIAQIPDEQLKQVLLSLGIGKQQIASHLMQGGLDHPSPMNVSFLLLGQRYTVDAHVLSNVTWDRVRAQRMLPDPLDVAFAALGNGQALPLLHDQLAHYQYAGDLSAMHAIVESHDASFWQSNLYNTWLSALRTLSPDPTVVADPKASGSPSIVATEAWGRRILNTQLASWAELRHDTLLYAKQSYTSFAVCEFPDAAVDPYPELFAALASFTDQASMLVPMLQAVPDLAREVDDYLRAFRDVAVNLQGIAEAQRDHRALSEAQLAFINDAVVVNRAPAGCTSIEVARGWYTRLFFRSDPLAFDPTIADVHTQPTDEVGNPVGKVLHVATGRPELMVVTLDGCSGGPRAYVGLAASYHELITDQFKRMTDEEWAERVRAGNPAAPTWMADLVQPSP